MTFFPSLNDGDGVPQALAAFSHGMGGALLVLNDAIMRSEDSPLSVGQREMIGAYVSGLNACRYCHNSHTRVAEAFGFESDLISALIDDVEAASIEAEMKPILRYMKKLTVEPSKMTQADADAVFDAGWSERALFDAIQVCAMFNYMNRFVEGIGIHQFAESVDMLIQHNYISLKENFNIT